eukprot:NODE_398_length_1408_cov_751.160412_g294_i0.p1 GENE.NODE_398_length_1408_cov_751.160412_g294_i0~~NODE_398_length_1408_cov_751.160412_g294_i0.p1  ORF type:complete len:334 (+),score=87.15 NODE_398_length_1408_cov_751.160412_g294_i0:137-1138(+)
MDYGDLRWEHLDKTKLFFITPCMSMCLRTIVYPLGLVKTRMQAIPGVGQIRYRNTMHAFSCIFRQEGFTALYKGFVANSWVMINGPFYIFALERSRAYCIAANARHEVVPAHMMERHLSNVLSGAFASMCGQVIVVPIDNMTQRLMVQRDSKTAKGAFPMVRDLLSTHGPRVFYRGFAVSLLTYVPSSACFWSAYHFSKPYARRLLHLPERSHQRWDTKDMLASMICGGAAAFVSAVVTNPLDVVRTRMQLDDTVQNPKFMGTLRQLVAKEGVVGFSYGLMPRVMSTMLSSSLIMMGYEALKRLSIKPDYAAVAAAAAPATSTAAPARQLGVP